MEMWIERKPYHFSSEGIKKIEGLRQAIHMGFWCTKSPKGGWNERPVDVFYVANPDTSRGHTNYFGIFHQEDKVFICDAASAFSEPIWGMLGNQGHVLVSKYRHDYREDGEIMVDGGRDYFKRSGAGKSVRVTVDGSEFKFEVAEYS